MGSGSTGVAAIKTGRHFIGIEKKEHHFKNAEKRIREAETLNASNLFDVVTLEGGANAPPPLRGVRFRKIFLNDP